MVLDTSMRLLHFACGALVLGLAACAPPLSGNPTAVTQLSTNRASMSTGPGGIDASGRATGPLDVNGFLARPSSGYPNCLVLQRPGRDVPYPIQMPNFFVGLGGECPSLYWRATIRSLEEFGQGILTIEGIGRCQISGGSLMSRFDSGSCDRI